MTLVGGKNEFEVLQEKAEKAAVIVKEFSYTKEKPLALNWNNRDYSPRPRSQSSRASACENANLLER